MRALVAFAFLSRVVLGAPCARADHSLHEKRAFDPDDWILTRRSEPDRILPLRIGLAQSNLDKLEEMLMTVAHPKSPDFGKHMSSEQVIDTFAPNSNTVEAVKNWLIGSGFSEDRIKLSVSRGWMEVTNATVAEVEDLLDTEYHVYMHPDTGTEQISASSISLFARPLTQDLI